MKRCGTWPTSKDIPHEIKPADFDEVNRSTKQFEEVARAKRPVLLLNELRKKTGSRIRSARDLATTGDQLLFPRTSAEVRSPPRGSRTSSPGFRPGCSRRSTTHPPDEAQRRLTIVYRLVFPAPVGDQAVAPNVGTAAPRARAGSRTAAGRSANRPRSPPSRSANSPF